MKNRIIACLMTFGALALGACTTDTSGQPDAANTAAKATQETAAANEAFLMSEIACWEVLAASDENSAYMWMILYGYTAGAKDQPQHDPALVEQIIGDAVEECVESPDASALATVDKHWR